MFDQNYRNGNATKSENLRFVSNYLPELIKRTRQNKTSRILGRGARSINCPFQIPHLNFTFTLDISKGHYVLVRNQPIDIL